MRSRRGQPQTLRAQARRFKLFTPPLQKTYETGDQPPGHRVLSYEKGRAPLCGVSPGGVSQGRGRAAASFIPHWLMGVTLRPELGALLPVSVHETVEIHAQPIISANEFPDCCKRFIGLIAPYAVAGTLENNEARSGDRLRDHGVSPPCAVQW